MAAFDGHRPAFQGGVMSATGRAFVAALAAVTALIAEDSGAQGQAARQDLSFEERVQAQESIERVRLSHQIGAVQPFDRAVPRAVLEEKVRLALAQSAALETFWHAPLTASALRAETERIFRQTRMPERLREMAAALRND